MQGGSSMKKKIVSFYILKDKKRTADWTQLIAVDEDKKEWVIAGSYCGGIPESHWEVLKK